MTLTMAADPLPFAPDGQGNIRVAGTRVTLSTILFVYRQGYSPADIVDAFPTVPLWAVHGVIAHYLRHRAEMDDYLREVETLEGEMRRRAQSQPGYKESVERLRARYAAMQAADAGERP